MTKVIVSVIHLYYICIVILNEQGDKKLKNMKTYKNVPFQKENGDLGYSDLLQAVKEQLEISYPDLTGESLTIVADLMCRFDQDVYEANGQFSCDINDL
jgi:hypothetical protein